jgi:hypothetical protein
MTEETTPAAAAPVKERASYQVKSYIDAEQLRRDLAFSQNDLTGAMMNQAGMFAHYGVLSAEAARQVDVVEMLLENAEAAVYKIIRDEMVSKGEKITESMLDKTVMRHQMVRNMKMALNEAKRVEALGKTAVEAFRHRRDMLIQHGLISREEMKSDIVIRGQMSREAAQDAQKQSFLERRNSENQ